MNEQVIRDFYGKVIGYVETLPNGDKIVRDFYRRVKGRYHKSSDTTRDFYGRIIAKGDGTGILLTMDKK